MTKMTPLGKVIITSINVKPDIKSKVILGEKLEKELKEDDFLKDAEFYCTLTVERVGPDVRPDIKVGSKIIVAAAKINHFDRIVFKGKEYHVIIDSESTVPVVLS